MTEHARLDGFVPLAIRLARHDAAVDNDGPEIVDDPWPEVDQLTDHELRDLVEVLAKLAAGVAAIPPTAEYDMTGQCPECDAPIVEQLTLPRRNPLTLFTAMLNQRHATP